MNLFSERPTRTAGTRTARTQLITLAVDAPRRLEDAAPFQLLLGAVDGVELVELDPVSARVWVFGDGTVEPEALVEALAAWRYGSYVLDHQFEVPA